MSIPQPRPETSGSQALSESASRTPGCAIGVLTGALTGGLLGAAGRTVVAIAFMYTVTHSGGTFFSGSSSTSLWDMISEQPWLIGISAAIGFVVCGVAGATCRIFLAAPIGAVLSALPCLFLVVFPSTFLMSMSGGNTEPDVRAVWEALAGMAVVGALAGAGGALAGRLAMKGIWRRSATGTRPTQAHAGQLVPTEPRSADQSETLGWFARPDNVWLVFCVGACITAVGATGAGIYSLVSGDGNLCFAGFIFLVVLVAGLFVAGPVLGIGLFLKTVASAADQNEKLVYETFAKLVNGRVYRKTRTFGMWPRAIEFLHRGLRVVVDSEYQRVDQHYLHYARATLTLPEPILFQCDLSPHCMLDALLRPGSQDVQLGLPVFDDEFRVRTNNASLAVQVLDKSIQLRLMQFKELSKAIRSRLTDPGRVYFSIDGRRIQIRLWGVISKPEEMAEFHRQFSNLFDELLPRLGVTVGQASSGH